MMDDGTLLILKYCLLMAVTFIIVILTFYFASEKDSSKGQTSVFMKNIFHERNKAADKKKYFPNDCKCQSLFIFNACNESKAILNISQYDWKSINRDIQRFRNGQSVIFEDIMNNIARYLPQAYKVLINGTVDTRMTSKDIDMLREEEQLKVKSNTVTPLDNTEIESVSSCGVHFYSPQEIKRCSNLLYKATGQPLRIAFVGDSTIRSLMEYVVKYTYKELNLAYYQSNLKLNIEENFLNIKAKADIPLVGNGLELRLYWAAYLEKSRNESIVLEQGARDVLESWVNEPTVDDPIPDILFIGGGVWDGIYYSGVEATANSVTRMYSIQGILEKLSKKVRIIWHMHPKFKDYVASRIVPNGVLEMMNQLSWLKLKNSNIWLWESLAILSTKEFIQCEYYFKANLIKYIPSSWKCWDPKHPGKMARKIGMNMLFNLSCNRVLGIQRGMCCS